MKSYLNSNHIYTTEVYKTQIELSKLGYLHPKFINGYFNLETEKAVKDYQLAHSMINDGVLTDKIYNRLVKTENAVVNNNGKYNRKLYTVVSKASTDEVKNKDAFFNDSKDNELRKGNVNIKIKYAETGEVTIQDVKYRSVGRQMNTSGEAIYEVFEFIAKDIKE